MTDAHTTRYETFHSKGRWQGLPTKVADGAAPVSFEPVPGLEGAPDDAPDVLIFGVPNTGMMTGQPTNVMLLGYVGDADRRLTLVDTGPNDGFEALSEAFDNAGIDMARVERIVLTHCHPDHVGSASAAQAASGALVFAHPQEQEQVDRFGEGIEVSQWIEDGEMIACDGFALRPILTPGHSPGHVCLVEPRTKALLAGDMMSGFGSVGIFPPNGSVRDYIASLRRLLVEYETTPFAAVCPGHGPVIADARAKIAEYIEHRLQREEEIFAAVGDGHATLDDLVPVIYPDVNDNFARAARGTLIMHLRKLIEDGRVRSVDETTYTVT